MPRRLGTLLAALALALAGCDNSPAPGNHPDASTDAGLDAGNPADAGPTDAGPGDGDGSGSLVGPMAVAAEPQGQFVYAVDQNANLIPFELDPSTGALSPGNPVPGVSVGGSFGGVGDPSSFAASGRNPIWVDGCTFVAGPRFVFDACPLPKSSAGTTANNEGGGSGVPHSPATSFTLTAQVDPVWGGVIVSDPAGIDIDGCGGGPNTLSARFPVGAGVTLRATPCSVPVQSYDSSWTGGCAGAGSTVQVAVSSDLSCHLHLTPVTTR